MALTPEATLNNTNNGKTAVFQIVENLGLQRRQNVQSVPLAGNPAQSNVLFPLTGKEQTFTVSFTLINDGEDISNGTHTAPVVTLQEQTTYLETEIDQAGLNVVIEFRSNVFLGVGVVRQGVLTNLSINIESGGRHYRTGTFQIKMGKIGLLKDP